MAAQDPYLHAGLTPATDVKLYPSQADGATTYTVSVSVTAAPTAAVTATYIPATLAERIRGGFVRPKFTPPERRPVVHRIHVGVIARCNAHVAVVVTYEGRRRQEDELLLVGAL